MRPPPKTVMRLALLFLFLNALGVGVWALFTPESFYQSFPGNGWIWVSVDGPYNEHLIRDLGGLNLAAPPGPVRNDTTERLALLDTLLALVAAERIEAIVADRESIGKAWFQGLKQRRLVFVMRVRHNTLIGSKGQARSAQKRYSHLDTQEVYACPKRCLVFGLRLYVSVTKSNDGELVVLVCNADPDKAVLRYAQRWQVEPFSQPSSLAASPLKLPTSLLLPGSINSWHL